MANLIIICGPQAVGKMTVAEKLRDKLKYNLMINHDSIEVSNKIFGFGTFAQKEFNDIFRKEAFEIAVKYNVDLIFTYVCAFDIQEEKDYLTRLANTFEHSGGSFYFIELSADINTRLKRNKTPHRIEQKPSKKDIKWTEEDILKTAKKHKLNSADGETWFKNHIKIDNTNLKPEEVVDIIVNFFSLETKEKDEKEYRYDTYLKELKEENK